LVILKEANIVITVLTALSILFKSQTRNTMKFALVPLAITLASASPVWKRQEVSSALSSVVAGATSAVSSVASEASSAVVSATSAASSVASSAVSSAAPSASASAVPAYAIAYPCPEGSDLTYVEEQLSFPGDLAAVTPLVAFNNATWYGVVANDTASATADIGAMRTVQFPGFPSTIMEVLVNMTMDPTTMAVQQEFNGTAPVTVGNLTLSSYNTVFQLYQNDTVPADVTAKIFTNACANPAAEVNAALSQLFTTALAALSTEASTAAGPAPVPSAPSAASSAPSAPVGPASSAAGSATSAVVSAASSVVASATELASSVVAALPSPSA